MTAATANKPEASHVAAMGWLAKMFELNPQGLNWARAVMLLDGALVPLVVLLAVGREQ